MAVSVQIKGKDKLLEAFDNIKVEAFSIWQGKQMLVKGFGMEELTALIEMFEDGATNAPYTIKWYEDITDKKQIKNNTPDDGSLNFRLNGEAQEITNAQYSAVHNRNELISKIGALENKFDTVLERLDSEPEPEQENKLGFIGEILGHPSIAPLIPQFVSMLMGTGQSSQPARLPQVATLGNVPNDSAMTEAITKLKLYDSKLSEHLAKLAHLAEKEPATFTMIMNSLDSYEIK